MNTGTLYDNVLKRDFKINQFDKISDLQKKILVTFIDAGKNEISEKLLFKLLSIVTCESIADNSTILDVIELFEKSEYSTAVKKTIKELLQEYIQLIKNLEVSDGLDELLNSCDGDTFYYVGVNSFVSDYYLKNPNTKWKIKAILQVGFIFDFMNNERSSETDLLRYYFRKRKWSIFIFTKQNISAVTIGFDDRNNYSHFSWNKERQNLNVKCALEELPEGYSSKLFLVWDERNDDQDLLLDRYLLHEEIPVFTNADYRNLKYSFEKVPVEFFRLDYLDYLSRYKKSVVDIFGYPDKNEKIKKLKNIVEFVKAPGKNSVYPDRKNRFSHVFIKDLYFKDGDLIPTVRIGEQHFNFVDFSEEYELQSYISTISPYYYYCLLSSELVSDYFSDRFDANNFYDSNTVLPLEECIYIEMSPEKMNSKKYKDKYEIETNTKLKTHSLIESKGFYNIKAKEIIEKYMAEIRNNIESGSYYSATIVMGAVLETFLIDWLSEIDSKDYFTEDYYIINKNTGKQERASFYDYIEIMKQKRPDWINNKSKMATAIRKKRYLIHPKLYISEEDVSANTCYELLENLRTIINNRWENKE